ncbi:GspE/PulE family protein [Termitidicoccus mucosus]|uniref:GspE/PulE family protein n=1 Tax=Termitidicoccus mucosus TaxID=1184151 RepID=UPI0009FBF8A2
MPAAATPSAAAPAKSSRTRPPVPVELAKVQQARQEHDFVWMPRVLKENGIGASSIKIATDYFNQQGRRQSYGGVLVELGILPAAAVAKMIAEHHGLQCVSLMGVRIPVEAVRLLSPSVARRLRAIPLRRVNAKVSVAITDPAVPGFAEVAGSFRRFGVNEVEYLVAPEAEVLARIDEMYATRADVSDPGRFFDLLVADAVNMGVSDIHLVPEETLSQIKFRIDGVMHPYKVIEGAVRDSIFARVKMKGGLDIAIRHIPQDGRAKLVVGGRKVNMRFNALPTLYGESIVIRILDQSKGIVPLDRLGMLDDTKAAILKAANAPFGFTYFVGPTGSGKTTSLYSIINTLDVSNYTMMTLEDPIEYEFRNIRQTEVTEQLTFAMGLRALLRQDPDYILVGETRDGETAELSMRAALTGHTGFSTLHANTALGGITRLIDMGVEPSIIIGAVNLFVSQRLIRRLCECKEPHPQSEAIAGIHGIRLEPGQTLYRPKPGGCALCGGNGYKGRVGLYECRPVEPFADIIVRLGKDALRECETLARKLCATETEQTGSSIFRTLRQDGFIKAAQGQTSIDEVVAQTEAPEGDSEIPEATTQNTQIT